MSKPNQSEPNAWLRQQQQEAADEALEKATKPPPAPDVLDEELFQKKAMERFPRSPEQSS